MQNPTPGGGTSNTLQFETDSAPLAVASPIFSPPTATVTAGSTASYRVTLPPSATSVSASCLNLPAGANCNYSASSGSVAITTSTSTPKGIYQVTVTFAETLPGAANADIPLPFLLLPLLLLRRRQVARQIWPSVCLAMVLMFGLTLCIGCGGGAGGSGSVGALRIKQRIRLQVPASLPWLSSKVPGVRRKSIE